MYELRYEHIYFKNKNYSNSLLRFKHMSSYSIGKVQIALVTKKKTLKNYDKYGTFKHFLVT